VAVPRFGVGEAAAARQHLADEGFVVFRDVLAPAEVDAALRLLWADLASLGTGIARGDPSTWHGDRRAISDCHFSVQFNHFIPVLLSYSVAVFLK
jgi:hypothetical protein